MNKAHIILTWEQMVDCPTVYFKITEDGMLLKYDVETEILTEYEM